MYVYPFFELRIQLTSAVNRGTILVELVDVSIVGVLSVALLGAASGGLLGRTQI